MKIDCKTLFDCSATGVTGHFRPSQIPFVDRAGQAVDNMQSWNDSRNQQRNWETLLQIVGLRTQPQDIVYPYCNDGVWHFSFTVESEGVFGLSGDPDPLAGLLQDCNGVPMLVNLSERMGLEPVLTSWGENQNIWFSINTSQD